MIAVCSYNVNSWQCTMFVNFFFFCIYCTIFFSQLRGVVCCQAAVAQGARPSQPGPRSRAAAQKHVGGGAKCGRWGSREGDASEAMCRTWAPPLPGQPCLGGCCLSWPPILFPSGRRARSTSQNVVEGKRMENQDGRGVELTKHDQRWCVGFFVGLLLTVWVRAGVTGWSVVDVWKERWVETTARLPVLMSRRRSSGHPWSALRPPGPGRPWS